MLRSSIGRTAALVAVVIGLALTTPGSARAESSPAFAATATATGSATIVNLGIDRGPTMVRVGSRLFVGSDDQVRVFTLPGAPVGVITGQTGVSDLVVASDGTMYAALATAGEISVIDPTTLTETSRVTSLPCVRQLAVNSSWLFAGYGCTDGQATVAVIERSTGAITSTLDRTWPDPPLVTATDSRLVVLGRTVSPALVASYSLAGGAATEITAASMDFVNTVALNPAGTRVVGATMNPAGLAEFDPDTLQQVASYATGQMPTGSAYSDDGSKLVATLTTASVADLQVFSTATGAVLTRRQALIYAYTGATGSIGSGTAVFDADGRHLRAIAVEGYPPNVARLAIIATKAPVATPMKVALGSRSFGKALPVTVVSRPGAHVTLTVDSGGHITTKTLKIGSSGKAAAKVRADYTGSVTASTVADADYAAGKASKKYAADSRTTVWLSGQYKASKGVAHFHSYQDVKLTARIAPGASHTAFLYAQTKLGKRWGAAQRVQLSVRDGYAYAHLLDGDAGTTARVKVTFKGDSYLRGSSSKYVTYHID